MDDPVPYIIAESIELGELERKVKELMAQGYVPQQMVVAPPVSGATSRPRYVVPLLHNGYISSYRGSTCTG